MKEKHLEWWIGKLSIEVMGDFEGILPQVEVALRELQKQGKSGKTIENHAEAIKGFINWSIKRGYLDQDPLKNLTRFDVTPQTTRRSMTIEEIRKVLKVAPKHRRLLYEVAFCSGLRRKELRSLTPDDIDTANSCLILRSEWTKNRKTGYQPLPADLIRRLIDYSNGGEALKLYEKFYTRQKSRKRIPKNPLLYVPSHTARDLDKDLAAAGVPKWKPGGKIDFHACRVAYISFVVETGTDLKTAQSMARHADPNITMNIYARKRHNRLTAVAEAVGKPILDSGNTTEAQRMAAGCES
ncbi:MAG: tyrosine-type recombinase/integrase, partial [Planctomycetota bacterium]